MAILETTNGNVAVLAFAASANNSATIYYAHGFEHPKYMRKIAGTWQSPIDL